MIIGIDDTGHIAPGERFILGIFYARPTTMPALLHAFARWKDLTRRQIAGRPAELKSTFLTDAMYRDFINKVLFAPGVTAMYYGLGMDVDDHALKWAVLQRDRYIDQYQAAITQAKAEGRPKWANEATTLVGWLRRTPPSYMLKMDMLNAAIPLALRQSIVESVLEDFDDELGDLRFHIDYGFIKDAGTTYWRDVLRSNIIQDTQTRPIPQIEEWPSDHPFPRTFIKEGRGPIAMFTPEFGHRIEFRDSAETPEVQLADIVAGLLRLKYIDRSSLPALTRLHELAPREARGRDMTVRLVGDLAAFDDTTTPPNPYEQFEGMPQAN